MKTLITTFAIAVMVFAFNANPAFATAETNQKTKDGLAKIGEPFLDFGDWVECMTDYDASQTGENTDCSQSFSENESGETDSEKEVADSGEEGSTSAASASDQ